MGKKEFLTGKDLSVYLKVSQKTIYTWVRKETVPFFQMGGLIRFDKQEIDTWVEQCKHVPKARVDKGLAHIERQLFS